MNTKAKKHIKIVSNITFGARLYKGNDACGKCDLRRRDVGFHYFRDFYYCDSGMIPWLLVLELLSKADKPLSVLWRIELLSIP